jgi:hypothetical protein
MNIKRKRENNIIPNKKLTELTYKSFLSNGECYIHNKNQLVCFFLITLSNAQRAFDDRNQSIKMLSVYISLDQK